MIYIFTPVCSAGPFPQLEDKPLNSKLLLVWEHLKDLLSQSPFFTNSKETHGVCCVKYSVISDV